MESYPVIPLFSAFVCISWIHYVFHCPKSKNYIENIPSYIQKLKYQESIFAFLVLHYCLNLIYQRKKTREMYYNELPTAFIILFCFRAQRIDYFKFYKTIPAQEAFSQLKQQIPNITENSSLRDIQM
jgi:hypothetical protein